LTFHEEYNIYFQIVNLTCRKLYNEWLLTEVENNDLGQRISISKLQILKWIHEAWISVSPDIIRHSFACCGITSTNADVINATKINETGVPIAPEARNHFLNTASECQDLTTLVENIHIDDLDDGISIYGDEEIPLQPSRYKVDLDASDNE
jgi:hypothetical protein